MRIALPAETLQHGVNIYILPSHGLMEQSTVNVATKVVCYLRSAYVYTISTANSKM